MMNFLMEVFSEAEALVHGEVGQQAEQCADGGEHRHDLSLLPAAHLKVMVQRRHFENALAVGELEIRHLNNVGQRLTDVDDTHQQQHQRHVVGEGQCRHRAAQEQGAGVAHEHLGGVAVIHQKTAQAAQHGGGKRAQLGEAGPDDGHGRKENGHGDGDAGAETVQPVGDVDGVDGAHDDEGGEDEVHRPRQHHMGVPEGDIQVGTQHPLVPHEAQERHGRRQLQHKLLQRRQAGVVVMLHLLIVVNVADEAEHQRKEIDVQVGEVAARHMLPAQSHDGDADTDNEHQAAHGGGALLGHVPGGADLLDGLAGLQPHQRRYQQLAGDDGDDKADRHRQHDLQNSHNDSLLPAAKGRGGSCDLALLFQVVRHDDPLIHGVVDVVDLLIVLVTLAGQDDDVAALGVIHGVVDGLHTVGNGHVGRVGVPHARQNVVDDGLRLLGAGVVAGDNDEVCQPRGDAAHDGALRLIPVAAAAKPPRFNFLMLHSLHNLSASLIDSTTVNNLYLSVTPLLIAFTASSILLITNLTPLGFAILIEVFLKSSFITASHAIKIQSASTAFFQEKAT